MARVDAPTPRFRQPQRLSYPTLDKIPVIPSPETTSLTDLQALPEGLRGHETVYGDEHIVVLTGSGTPTGLKKDIATRLGLVDIENPNGEFPNHEERVLISSDVSGKTVFILQSATPKNPASGKMETLAMVDAAKFAGADHIVNINFHDPYTRAERHFPIGSHALGVRLTNALAEAGVDTIVDFNIHSEALMEETKDRVNWVNIDAFPQLAEKLRGVIGDDLEHTLFVSPDKGGEARAREYAQFFGAPLITSIKTRKYEGDGSVDRIEILDNEIVHEDGTKTKKTDTRKRAVIIDDMVDTAGTLSTIIGELEKEGAEEFVIVAAHAICSGKAVERLMGNEKIKHLIFTNSLPIPESLMEKTSVASLAQPTVDFMVDYLARVNEEKEIV